jgi:hypothetical protein
MACLCAAQLPHSLLSDAQQGALVEAVAPLLDDADRYNRLYASLALRRMPDPQAKERLLHFMFTVRFDSDGKF